MSKADIATSIPRQQRAIATYERLLESASELLAAYDFEKVSTNLIAEHAGVSPPALYRYFSDKYDLIGTVGKRWIGLKDQLIFNIGKQIKEDPDYVLTPPMVEDLLREMVAITEGFTGGVAVMRCLRTVPQLNHIVNESHDEMARSLVEAAVSVHAELDEAEIYRQVRLSMEIGYSAMEFVLGDPSIDRKTTLRDASLAIAAFSDLVQS